MLTYILLNALASNPNPSPDFLLRDGNGQAFTTDRLTQSRAFLVFLAKDCPKTAAAVPELNRFANLPGVQMVGVIRGNLGTAQAVKQRYNAKFPVIADPNGVTMKRFQAKRSLDFTFVAEKSEASVFPKTFAGWSQENVRAATELWQEYGAATQLNWFQGFSKNKKRGKVLPLPRFVDGLP